MHSESDEIPITFLEYASGVLGETSKGLTGANIIRVFGHFAVEYDVEIPYSSYPNDAPNKRTMISSNLKSFSAKEQYTILKEMCNHSSLRLKKSKEIKQLEVRLVSRYKHLSPTDEISEVNEILIEETKHWLNEYPDSLDLYSQALEKYEHEIYQRNLLDDLRLSLEKLLKEIFENNKTLENQQSYFGSFIKSSNGSPEFANMFSRLVNYYASYNNTYVKHDDAVIEEEIEFIMEITSSFMKHLIRLK